MIEEQTSYVQSDYYFSGRHLWRSVLLRAMQEASGEYVIVLNTRRERANPAPVQARLRRAAVEWLTRTPGDHVETRRKRHFVWCCCGIGIDVRKIEPHPKKPGELVYVPDSDPASLDAAFEEHRTSLLLVHTMAQTGEAFDDYVMRMRGIYASAS